MLSKDYLVRQFLLFAAMLDHIRLLLLQQEPDAALEAVEEALQGLAGLGLLAALDVPDRTLLDLLLFGWPALEGRARVAAASALLAEAANAFDARHRPGDAYAGRLQALGLLIGLAADDPHADLPAFAADLDALLAALRPHELPARTWQQLWRFFERRGEFGRAEDALFALLEQEPDTPGLVEMGLEFYRRLLKRHDDELEAGNLPRDEVEAGMVELESRRIKSGREAS